MPYLGSRSAAAAAVISLRGIIAGYRLGHQPLEDARVPGRLFLADFVLFVVGFHDHGAVVHLETVQRYRLKLSTHRNDADRHVFQAHAQQPVQLAEHRLSRDDQHPQRGLGQHELKLPAAVVEDFLAPHPHDNGFLYILGAALRPEARQDATRVRRCLDRPGTIRTSA